MGVGLTWCGGRVDTRYKTPQAVILKSPGNSLNNMLSWEIHAARTQMRATKATWVQKGQGWGLCGCRAAVASPEHRSEQAGKATVPIGCCLC